MKPSDFYIKAISLPLLQGLSAENILQMQERGAIRVISMEPEEGGIVVEGQYCKTLILLMEGTVACTTRGDGWTLTEEIHAPEVIEEEALWSLSQTYKHTYTPVTEGRMLIIDRQHVMHTLMHYDVFRINLLARMSTRLERMELLPRQHSPRNTTVQKIYHFIHSISHTANFPKSLHIKMTTLADIVDETRLNVSRALRTLQQQGVVSLSRGHIIFSDLVVSPPTAPPSLITPTSPISHITPISLL